MENTNKSSSSILKRLFSDLSGHKLLVVLSLISTVIQVGLTVYLPILIGQAVNQTIGEGQVNFDVLLPTLMNMGIVIGLNAIVQWVNPILFNKITYSCLCFFATTSSMSPQKNISIAVRHINPLTISVG